jgi:hypothetical protein
MMSSLVDQPWPVLAVSVLVLWLASWIGARSFTRFRAAEDAASAYYDIILGATLGLLSLIIGFSFSMAINHYDQRKGFENAEANTIRTAYLRADLLEPADAVKMRAVIGGYLGQRIAYYDARDEAELRQIDIRTTQTEAELWSAVRVSGASHPLVVLGINDMMSARGSSEASWSNRISLEAWILMAAIAICGNVLIGYGARKFSSRTVPILILPTVVVISISLYLIDDIDSPRGGIITVTPVNLRLLADSLSDPSHPLVPDARLSTAMPPVGAPPR